MVRNLCLIIFCFFFATTVFGKITYKVDIKGYEDHPYLKKTLYSLSELVNPEFGFTPMSDGVLRDIGQSDLKKIGEYLSSLGFYDAYVFQDFIETDTDVFQIDINLTLGRRYRIGNVQVLDTKGLVIMPSDFFTVKEGEYVEHSLILNDKTRVGLFFKQHGYAYVVIASEVVNVDHATGLVQVTYNVNIGPKGNFGEVSFEGLVSVREDYITQYIQIEKDTPYTVDLVNRAEKKLLDTGLFKSVETKILTYDTQKGHVPIKFIVEERKPNRFSARAFGKGNFSQHNYAAGIGTTYKHINLFGSNEELKTDFVLKYQNIGTSSWFPGGEVQLSKPHWPWFSVDGGMFFKKSDEVSTFVTNEQSALLCEKNFKNGGVQIRYQPLSYLNCSVDPQLEFSKINIASSLTNSYFILPFKLSLDTRNNTLFSDNGIELTMGWNIYSWEAKTSFQKFYMRANNYFSLGSNFFILALMCQYQSLFSQALKKRDVPFEKRFFLGGNETLRGYPNNFIGVTENTMDKIVEKDGGLSSLNFCIEPRIRVYENSLWVAFFLEGGQVSNESNFFADKKAKSKLYWDWGISFLLSFYNIGPFRLDISYALTDEIKNSKDKVQIGFSFGQAF
jgi:translocation and assembly module TamA